MTSIVINSFPQDINDAFDVTATIIGAKVGINYLRIELYKEGTKNYFGDTFNGENWYGGSVGSKYLLINVKEASTSASIKGRIGSPNANEYSGPGEYKLKVKRYTASGNPANDDETPVSVHISLERETPTPLPTITINPVPIYSSTPQIVLPSATILVSGEKITPAPTIQVTSYTPIPTPLVLSDKVIDKSDSSNIIAAFIFALGLFFVSLVFITKFKNKI